MPRSVGAYIEGRRKAAGLSRRALAEAVGVAPAEVAFWEREGRLPDRGVIGRVAAALGVSTDLLFLHAGWVPPDRVGAVEAALRGEAPAPDVAAPSPAPAPRPYLETALGILYQGDCLEVMRALPDRSVDCVFADPPFNLAKDYGGGVDDDLDGADYLTWSQRWIDEAVRLLKDGGAFFLYNLPRWNVHLAAHLDRFLAFRHWIAVDIKFSLPIPGRLYPSHYALLYFVKGARPARFDPPRLPLAACRHCGGELRDYGGYKDKMNPLGVNLTDVWYDIPPVRHRRYKNRRANELPLKMLDRVLDIATAEGDVILDPFGGSGTTFAAAELRGRRWIGIEKGDCAPIGERLSSLDGERRRLAGLRAELNTLFTAPTLALRERFGHDTSRYRLPPDLETGGESAASEEASPGTGSDD